MLSFLFPRQKTALRPLLTDFHSHLIPGIDDGVKTPEESFQVIEKLVALGYTKVITTPHIMTDYYGNTAESISAAYHSFLPQLKEKGYPITFEFAAEYYFDEIVYRLVENKEKLLTFGDRYLLFETNVISEPLMIKEFIFSLTSQNYKPILAHPERYMFMDINKAQDFRDRGVLLQLNLLSLIGFYGPAIQKLASKMIDAGLVDALGSDCHNSFHADLLPKVQNSKLYRKALDLPLLNYIL